MAKRNLKVVPAARADQSAISSDNLDDLRPRLWEAQSLCRLVDMYAQIALEDEDPTDQETAKMDICNATRVINRLLEETQDAINVLDQKVIDARTGDTHENQP